MPSRRAPARSPKSDLELEPLLVAGEPPHLPKSALRACSLASLLVRFQPALGPRGPTAARRRWPPSPCPPLASGGVRPPGWPATVCDAGESYCPSTYTTISDVLIAGHRRAHAVRCFLWHNPVILSGCLVYSHASPLLQYPRHATVPPRNSQRGS